MAKDLVRTRRYIQKFYQMKTQLQAVGLRIQALRSNQQMAEAMRGATRVRPMIVIFSQFPNRCRSEGYGFYESRSQSTSHPENHERF